MLRALPPLIEPDTWILAFHKTSKYRWVRWLAFGKYKHVSAFACVRELDLWLVYDVTLAGTRLMLLPDSLTAQRWIADRTLDADLVRMPVGKRGRCPLMPFYCVPAIKHLVGIQCGALRVDALRRHCLRNGGTLLDGKPAQPDDEPGHARCAAAGAG